MSTKDSGGGEYEDILTSHDYDGIQEYDNPMPYWWKAIFVLTVIWAGFYLVGIEMGYIDTYGDTLSAEEEAIASIRQAQQKDLPPVDDKLLLAAAGDEALIAEGAKVYTSTCASCHGQKGEGLIGPNLTDKFWLHGGSVADIHKVVVEGVVANGMPAWGPVIGREGGINVSAYVYASLRGTNVEGKAPQGEAEGEAEPAEGDAPAEDKAEEPAGEPEAPAEEPPAEVPAE